jgi:hypothetical protein
LTAAYGEIRKHFDQNSHVTDSKAIAALCAEGFEAAHFLSDSVVQGKLNARGNFGVTFLLAMLPTIILSKRYCVT